MDNTSLLELKAGALRQKDHFLFGLPKIELHVHIEGTMTPDLRWRLAARQDIPVLNAFTKLPCQSQEEFSKSYDILKHADSHGVQGGVLTFFDLYYGGFDVLIDEEDFYDLAVAYFRHAAAMNPRYCEPFFDPQGHTRRGVKFSTVMSGLRRAQVYAAQHLNIECQWIMCIMRDETVDSALAHLHAALEYQHMIVGIGLDSLERNRPPLLFDQVFRRAREAGFKLTCHCDVNEQDTLKHIRQAVDELGGQGVDRIDHGLNAAEDRPLMSDIKEKKIGMTLCPWAYLCYCGEDRFEERFQRLYAAGIDVAIGSDDPAYMEEPMADPRACYPAHVELLDQARHGEAAGECVANVLGV